MTLTALCLIFCLFGPGSTLETTPRLADAVNSAREM